MRIRFAILFLVAGGLFLSPAFAKEPKDKHQQLPPGLQKKAEAGKPLPLGWQKKLAKGEILDRNVYAHGEIVVPVDSNGAVTIRVDGKLIRLYEATREIIDILQ